MSKDIKELIDNTTYTKQGNGISGRVYFKLITDSSHVNAATLQIIQGEKGYPHQGYDFFRGNVTQENGKHIHNWSCSTSCD